MRYDQPPIEATKEKDPQTLLYETVQRELREAKTSEKGHFEAK